MYCLLPLTCIAFLPITLIDMGHYSLGFLMV